jgi:hypothetical protein
MEMTIFETAEVTLPTPPKFAERRGFFRLHDRKPPCADTESPFVFGR